MGFAFSVGGGVLSWHCYLKSFSLSGVRVSGERKRTGRLMVNCLQLFLMEYYFEKVIMVGSSVGPGKKAAPDCWKVRLANQRGDSPMTRAAFPRIWIELLFLLHLLLYIITTLQRQAQGQPPMTVVYLS